MLNSVTIRDGHDNFFTPMRLFFALMVVAGHTYIIALKDVTAEPSLFFHYKPSYLAVNLFFIASGFLVTKSMLYRGDMAEFSSARILRIFPALAVHVLFVMFIMGPFVTSLPLKEFFSDPQFYTQPFQVLSFYKTEMIMPGALETNHEPIASAAIWTLRYEVLAYIGTAIAFSIGLLRKKWMLLAQFVGFAVLWAAAHGMGYYDKVPATVQSILRFGMAYGLGAAIYAYREKLSFSFIGVFVTGLVTALFHGTIAFEMMTNIWLAYIIFWAAYVKVPTLDGLKKLSDVSYGIYIYHWAVAQWIFYKMPSLSTGQLLFLTLLATLILSILSWFLVEKPMLTRKTWFAKFLRFGRTKRGAYNPAAALLD